MSQYKSEGFDVSCCVLADSGFEGDKDEMWKFHIMSLAENVAALKSKAVAAAGSSSNGPAKDEGESAAETNEEIAETPAAESGDKEDDAGDAAEPPSASEEDASASGAVSTAVDVAAGVVVVGVEDVIWVTVDKASGAAPELPAGYSLLSESDLAPAEDADAVFLAVRMGPTPRIAGVRMYCAPTTTAAEGEGEGESTAPALDAIIANCFPGREVTYRAAPRAIEALQSGPCGLLLEMLPESAFAEDDEEAAGAVAAPSAAAAMSAKSSAHDVVAGVGSERRAEGGEGMDANASFGSRPVGEIGEKETTSGLAGDDEEDDPYLMGAFGGVPVTLDDDEMELEAEAAAAVANKRQLGRRGRKTEEDLVNDLETRLLALETEQNQIISTNMDLQKKAAALIAKEKANIQSKNAASGLGNAGAGAQEEVAAVAVSLSANDLQALADAEAEREKLYVETLQKIVNGRVRLERQQSEFDQLSLYLQTRLDDKEFKAGEIKDSFAQFKKEIFAKAENSRTGNKIPKSVVEAFESAEQAREDALEKVRLRNISLRTTLRKLERTYRAREQLADGLHMIDFEQLKIENQTLHEKIEERNEELAKLKRKKTVTVQVLTHVREKLRYYEKNNKANQSELNVLEMDSMKLRAEVSITKKGRDALRDDNKDLKLKQGFASNDLLISDFEKRKRTIYVTKDKIRDLQERYRALSAQVVPYESMGPKGSHSLGHSQMGGGSRQPGSTAGSKMTTMYPPAPGQTSGSAQY